MTIETGRSDPVYLQRDQPGRHPAGSTVANTPKYHRYVDLSSRRHRRLLAVEHLALDNTLDLPV
jgi:hypothetical protein